MPFIQTRCQHVGCSEIIPRETAGLRRWTLRWGGGEADHVYFCAEHSRQDAGNVPVGCIEAVKVRSIAGSGHIGGRK